VINRIRDVRKQKRMTLADVALRCHPPTTPQTIGRLETGMRNLSLDWMNKIAAALEVAPEVLLRADEADTAKLIARLGENGVEALNRPTDALLPSALLGGEALVAMAVDAGAGEYRGGDQIWLRRIAPDAFLRALNRDILAPRPAGRFAFGRMIDGGAERVALLPPGAGQRQIVIDHPPWLAVAEMLIRRL
jgi:transcriptional regulator with XRE-family HTH domain